MATLKCYSGGKLVKTLIIKHGYEAEEGNIAVQNEDGETVFFWSGTFSVESQVLGLDVVPSKDLKAVLKKAKKLVKGIKGE